MVASTSPRGAPRHHTTPAQNAPAAATAGRSSGPRGAGRGAVDGQRPWVLEEGDDVEGGAVPLAVDLQRNLRGACFAGGPSSTGSTGAGGRRQGEGLDQAPHHLVVVQRRRSTLRRRPRCSSRSGKCHPDVHAGTGNWPQQPGGDGRPGVATAGGARRRQADHPGRPGGERLADAAHNLGLLGADALGAAVDHELGRVDAVRAESMGVGRLALRPERRRERIAPPR